MGCRPALGESARSINGRLDISGGPARATGSKAHEEGREGCRGPGDLVGSVSCEVQEGSHVDLGGQVEFGQ
jgi:hypothetical protein